MNRRDFIKCIPLLGALAAVPKALAELELPPSTGFCLEQYKQPHKLPLELETALAMGTTLRLDPLGIRLERLDEFREPEEWRAEVLRRWDERL